MRTTAEDITKNVLRILQLLWALLLTALIGNVIASNINAAGSAEAAVNFAMFVVVLSWLAAILGLAANRVERLSEGPAFLVMLALDGAATLFTLIAGIVLAAKLRATNCGGDLDPKVLGADWIGFGSGDDHKRCREVQASTAFMWFLFACFCATTVFTVAGARRGGAGPGSTVGGSTVGSSSVRTGLPHMSEYSRA